MQKIQIEAAKTIRRVVTEGRNFNDVLSETLRKNNSFTPQQRGALKDICYGSLRHYKRLEFMLNKLLTSGLSDENIKNLLVIAIYQLQYTKAGKHTVVDQAVSAIKSGKPQFAGLVNAILRNYIRKEVELCALADASQETRYSYPLWWIKKINSQYGDQAQEILSAGNTHPPMCLRVNNRLIPTDSYQKLLEEGNQDARIIGKTAILLQQPVPVEQLPGFNEGLVSVQDRGAQFAAEMMEVKNGMYVLDACAAPGGKTAHLLETTDIKLLALDKDETRLKRVRENLERLKLKAEIKCAEAQKTKSWWEGQQFDRILADIPCSASGVVRRHPDIKWLRREKDISGFAEQQREILAALWPLLKNGGRMMYATCSIFKEENDDVIDWFQGHNPDAIRIQLNLENTTSGKLLPSAEHDGFFYAMLEKQA